MELLLLSFRLPNFECCDKALLIIDESFDGLVGNFIQSLLSPD
jgi:hypothetical protein